LEIVKVKNGINFWYWDLEFSLSRKIVNGIIYNFLQLHYPIIIIKYVLDQYKKIIFGKKYQSKKNMDYIWGALVPELILGMNKKIGYYAISSVKK